MAGLDPAIYVFLTGCTKDVDARDKRGHDDGGSIVRSVSPKASRATLSVARDGNDFPDWITRRG